MADNSPRHDSSTALRSPSTLLALHPPQSSFPENPQLSDRRFESLLLKNLPTTNTSRQNPESQREKEKEARNTF
ncbi:unnamed protein product [Penicillium manginii]